MNGVSPEPRWLPLTLLFLLIYLEANVALTSEENEDQEVFHNQFAVHIEHPLGTERADALAATHGFINLGQIGTLDGHYLFEHRKVQKRSADASHEHHAKLHNEPDVRWVEQQRELKRLKRDLQSMEPEEEVNFPMPDPLWRYQWFLNHGAHDGSDMHVQPAWNMGYTGLGVVVTILDDGIQTNHPDLIRNYDPLASADINSNDDDPMPRDNGDNKHGTRCAGEVAAEAFNNICGVGIAYNASIGGVRMLDGMVNDAVEAKALSLNPQHIDIYSASWGPEDDGKTVDGPGHLAKKAFVDGVKFGRKGKGSIFVWASGNGGRKTDNCNCDGYTNSIFTLSISSASQGGRKPWYLEECSSTLATTYSSGTPSQDDSITTVDQDAQLRPDKICTSYHTGTSASAPIAAGVCALALQANPTLTWRDMQHLVVLTSVPDPLQLEHGWETNGVGRKYSHKFGYGLMDATAMVNMAKVWPGVGKQSICETKSHKPNAPIPDNSNEVTRVKVVSDGCAGTSKEIRYLEHVQCKISLQYNPRGALHIILTSPSGTKSSLLLPRPKDKSTKGFDDWPFLSVHFWGERPEGNWTLEVYRSPRGVPENVNMGKGILKEWKLMFYGTKDNILDSGDNDDGVLSGEAVDDIVEEEEVEQESTAGAPVISAHVNRTLIAQHSEVGADGCNAQCAAKAGCSGTGPHQCRACQHFRFGNICLAGCPARMFATVEHECYPCSHGCHSCFGPEVNQCRTCSADRLLLSDKALCVEKCPWGYRLESKEKKSCLPCPEKCESCTEIESGAANEPAQLVCTSCTKDLVISADQKHCLDNCPAGFFINSQTRKCDACDVKCATCIGPLPTQCARCQPNTFYFQRRCVAKCPARHTEDKHNSECVPCPNGCANCMLREDGATGCQDCLPHWRKDFMTNECTPEPNVGCDLKPSQFGDPESKCRDCHSSCATCSGGTADDCLSCQADHLLHISSCLDSCPHMTFPVRDGLSYRAHCKHCPHACETCTDTKTCTKCNAGYVFSSNGRCGANCGLTEHNMNGECKSCHEDCLSCNGFGDRSCLSCKNGLVLNMGQCGKACPMGLYAQGDACLPCHASCKSCSGGSHTQCQQCNQGMKLLPDGSCASCAPAFFFDRTCRKCHPSCSSCSGPSAAECLACAKPLAHDPWNRSCATCCASVDDKECCECAPGCDRCIVASRGASAKKRSFHDDITSSSRSAFFFFCVLSVIFVLTFMLWRAYGRAGRIHLRRLRKHSSNGDKKNGGGFLARGRKRFRRKRRQNGDYSQVPLEVLEGSNGDLLPNLEEEEDSMSDEDVSSDATRLVAA